MRTRQVTGFLLLAAGLVAVSALTVVSPLALTALDHHRNWSRLSEIGSTYGAASAVLSALALTGIAVSLLLQAHQTSIARLHSYREQHLALSELAARDAVFRRYWAPRTGSEQDWRAVAALNLIIGFWLTGWEMGTLSEPTLMLAFDQLFDDDLAKRWWATSGRAGYATLRWSRRTARFAAFADQAAARPGA